MKPLGSHVPNLQVPYNGAFSSAPDSYMSSPSGSPMRGFGTEQVVNSAFSLGKPYSDGTLLGSGHCFSPGSGHNPGHNSMGGDMSKQLFCQPSGGIPEYSPISSPRMIRPGPNSRQHIGAVTSIHSRPEGGTANKLHINLPDDGKQQSHRLPLPPVTVSAVVSCTDSAVSTPEKPQQEKSNRLSLFQPLPIPACIFQKPNPCDLDVDLVTASVFSEISIDSDDPVDLCHQTLQATDYENGIGTAASVPSSLVLKDRSSSIAYLNSREAKKPPSISFTNNHTSIKSPKMRLLGSHVPNLQVPYNGAFSSASDNYMLSPSKSPMGGFDTKQVVNSAFSVGKPYSDVTSLGSGHCSSPSSVHNSGHNSMGGDMLGQLFWQPSSSSPEYSPMPSPRMTSSGPCPRVHSGAVTHIHPRPGGGITTELQSSWPDDGKQQSHRLPFPPVTGSAVSIPAKPRQDKSSKSSLFQLLPTPECIGQRPNPCDLDVDLVTASVSCEISTHSDDPVDSSRRSPQATDFDNGTRNAASNASSLVPKDQSSSIAHLNSREAKKPPSMLFTNNHASSRSPKMRTLGYHVPNLQVPYNDAFSSAPDSYKSSPSKSPMRGFGTEQVVYSAFSAGKPYSDVTLLGSGHCSSPGSGHNSGHNSMGGDISGQYFWQPSRGSPEYSPVPSPRMTSPGPCSRVHSVAITPIHPRPAGGAASELQTSWPDVGKHQSHRLPLPPVTVSASVSLSNLAATSPSVPQSLGMTENLTSPGAR